jgi:predicted peptidase
MRSHLQNTVFLFFSLAFSYAILSCSNEIKEIKSSSNSIAPNYKHQPLLSRDTIKAFYSKNEKKITYTQLTYNLDTTEKNTTFILFLHGAGERGIDNQAHLKVGLPNLVSALKKAGLKNFVVLAPQCPLNERWVDVDWTTTSHVMKKNPHWPLDLVLSLMDSITQSNPAFDTTRFYVTGLSMGGYGTWEVLQRRPNMFSAAIPICGGGDISFGKSLVNIPIWMFHGKNDKAVPVVRTTEMFNCIQQEIHSLPLKAKMTIYENKGHLIWNETYDNLEVINWLLTQKNIK